ncbi:phosphatase PAP2 family protein [Streptomyces xiamenensis]|uniref:Integral membrane protein n=1 Tax=Streptomyces xiamenensis TaxID=408015 RepID=A0A0F7FWZ5_9ACTN|nr:MULTISPECIES: phosphatase PAP2 family protein [Streptomyces]AKG44438.1 integral membrane protein [Streptomyces xiamenensis]
MAGLDNPDIDVDLLYKINGYADSLPGWVSDAVTFLVEYGFAIGLVLAVLGTWFLVRSRAGSAQAVAGVSWALGAAGVSWLINQPISSFVARPRPFIDHPDLHVLVEGKTGWSFVSDHSAGAMAIAVGLLLVHRKIGIAAIVLAFVQGFGRVFTAVHYPTDVLAGFALATAVALLLSPLALYALTPLVRVLAGTRLLGWIAVGEDVRPDRDRDREQGSADGADGSGGEQGGDDGGGRHRARARRGVTAA